MNGPCVYEERVTAALCSANIGSELRSHIAGCGECGQIAAIAGFLRGQADTTKLAHAPLPDANVIWWTAKFRAQRAAAERATLPIKITKTIGAIAACATVAFALRSPEIQRWLAPVVERTASCNPLILVTGLLTIVGTLFGGVYFALNDCTSR